MPGRHDFLFAYSLPRRATCWRDQLEPRPGTFAERRQHGVLGRPALSVEAYADHVRVELEYDYSSGHMWIIETERLLAEVAPERARRELAPIAAPADLDRLEALYRDPLALGPGRDPVAHARAILDDLFVPHRDLEPDRVDPAEATVFELGQSVSGDGKVPYLTARLGRERIELALDHRLSSSAPGPGRQRRIEVLEAWDVADGAPAITAASAAIAARMGDEIGAAVRLFYGRAPDSP